MLGVKRIINLRSGPISCFKVFLRNIWELYHFTWNDYILYSKHYPLGKGSKNKNSKLSDIVQIKGGMVCQKLDLIFNWNSDILS